jgi:glycosyl-4,4'-diaponeurosporenoate acyltransferase
MTDATRLVFVDAVVWAAWSALVGYTVHLVPDRWFARDTWLTRPRALERSGRLYERLRIRRWKNHLPEAGAAFASAGSKRTLSSRSPDIVGRLVIETRRAEYVHVAIAVIAPAFALWNPWWLTAAMFTYAVVANIPCIMIQRYNRARLTRLRSSRDPRPVLDS